ncbi:hypothetical protein [Sorangium cellulosum]|nr:hypothetical protein [Sorangium cellulosum]
MQKKRRVLRAPFIVTVAAAASFAGAVALPGCNITVQGGHCPEEMPARESRCNADDLACAYVDSCDNPIGYRCVDGAWQVEAEMSCNPPPPECPGPACNPPAPPPTCPDEMPKRESSCNAVDLSCAYVDSCDNPIGYRCVDGAWQVEAEMSCNPPPPPQPEECLTAATADECAGLSPACQWLVPGCADEPGPPALPAAGCFPRPTCEDDAACPDGMRCQEVIVDPCGASSSSGVGSCAACGMARNVCLLPAAATDAAQ